MKPFTNELNRQNQKGLTLIELLVVLAILAFLATLVAPRVITYLGRAKSDVARSQLANISSALELFYFDMGRYPSVQEGLISLVNEPGELADWRGPYLKEEKGLTDPWGRDYLYTLINPDFFKVSSFGRDGEPGGEDEDQDLEKS
ncbi:MAG: type II secretion system major pseudopilin GspG [Pseudomonadota bacterium]